MKTIGKLLGNNKAELEYYVQGYIYKDFEAFESKTDDICYIPEYGVDDEDNIESSYTYADFVGLIEKWLYGNAVRILFLKENNYTKEDLIQNLFDAVDWQHPETVLEEWDMSGAYTE